WGHMDVHMDITTQNDRQQRREARDSAADYPSTPTEALEQLLRSHLPSLEVTTIGDMIRGRRRWLRREPQEVADV
ncbi:MAG: hypothetical protein ACOY3P_07345, partial [Planctomycetota bacterium]